MKRRVCTRRKADACGWERDGGRRTVASNSKRSLRRRPAPLTLLSRPLGDLLVGPGLTPDHDLAP